MSYEQFILVEINIDTTSIADKWLSDIGSGMQAEPGCGQINKLKLSLIPFDLQENQRASAKWVNMLQTPT